MEDRDPKFLMRVTELYIRNLKGMQRVWMTKPVYKNGIALNQSCLKKKLSKYLIYERQFILNLFLDL